MTEDKRLELIQQIAMSVTNEIIVGLQEATHTCLHCEFWLKERELCNNAINCPGGAARPPANIIAFGCDHFKRDIPFSP